MFFKRENPLHVLGVLIMGCKEHPIPFKYFQRIDRRGDPIFGHRVGMFSPRLVFESTGALRRWISVEIVYGSLSLEMDMGRKEHGQFAFI